MNEDEMRAALIRRIQLALIRGSADVDRYGDDPPEWADELMLIDYGDQSRPLAEALYEAATAAGRPR